VAWDKNKPGNVKLRVGRQEILANNDALEPALSRDHNFPGTPTTDDGEHLKITLHAPLADDPTAETDKGFLYLKDVSAKAELFFEDEDGHEIQLTTGGTLNMAGVMFLAGAQDVSGAKTFQATLTMSGANIAMAGAETIDGVDISAHKEGTAKAQHDGGVGDHTHESTGAEGGILTGSSVTSLFGDWATRTISLDTVYGPEATDGIIHIRSTNINDRNFYILTDSANPPTTERQRVGGSGASDRGTIVQAIKRGHYWKVTTTTGATIDATAYWLPIGV